MELIGYFLVIFIGISLGLIGGGGSILAVPVLVYLFQLPSPLATSYSLIIVGFTSFTFAVSQAIRNQVNVRAVFSFGITSVTSIFVTRRYILPGIPETLLHTGNFTLYKSTTIMILFAVLMLLASALMIKGYRHQQLAQQSPYATVKLALYGIGVGLITGILGAGGGFLIMPALIILARLPPKEAIGTSLFITAVNSLVGFAGDIGHVDFNWLFVSKLLAVTILGVFLGGAIGRKIPGEKLRVGFGWFLFTAGIGILVTEVLHYF